MIQLNAFSKLLKQGGINFLSGVPCSYLKNLINYSLNHLNYIAATNEGEAIAIAAGVYLGGQRSAVLMQNSGLMNAVGPLTSLNYVFKIPVLGFVSLRGEPAITDEPQHILTGQITHPLLDLCRIKTLWMERQIDAVAQQMAYADDFLTKGESVFFIVRKGTFADHQLEQQFTFDNYAKEYIKSEKVCKHPKRFDALTILAANANDNTLFLATTGKTGRELFELSDQPSNLYMVGSMGCISSIGLGLAMAKPNKEIIAIDGDGSLLMRMGSLATNGYYRPNNMLHICLDNGCHDSTGGQDSVSRNVELARIAHFSGYPCSVETNSLEELNTFVKSWQKDKKLTFIHMQTAKGSKKDLGRPTVSPIQVKERFMEYLK